MTNLAHNLVRTAAVDFDKVAIWGRTPSFEDYIKGWARRATLVTRVQELLGSDRLLLTPVSIELPFEQDADL
ncbi:hypothetical protein [Streptomyces geranii]|uniref:hypothetical protein n=1 Tax=Streptomyces geranii TaxID=2058923 RepID=UPI0018E4FC5F|nr:hypothetical protein [Streptomyces geranii]